MALKCAACGKFIKVGSGVICPKCSSRSHHECVRVPVGSEVSSDWRCGDCQARTPKGRNPATLVRVTEVFKDLPQRSQGEELGVCHSQVDPLQGPSIADVTLEQTANEGEPSLKSNMDELLVGFRKMQDDISIDIRSLKADMTNLFSEFREVRLEMADFRVSIAGITARMDGLEQRLGAVEQECATVAAAAPASHSPAIAHLQTVVGLLQQEVADRDQEALLSDLEIGHLPEERGESALQAVTVLAARLGVELEPRDVVYAERVGLAQGAAAGGEQPRTRRLVVRLARRDVRDNLLAAARVRRSLTTADAGRAPAGGAHARIYINERLTRSNRVLFARARELARKHQWRYVWTKRGRVNVREADGKQAFQIRSQSDLDRIFALGPI